MDLNDRIAARRRELAEQELEAAAAVSLAKQQQKAAERENDARARAEREAVLVESLGRPVIDADASPERIKAVLRQEARRRFTPSEKWQVFGSIAAGILTIGLGGLGVLAITFGVIRLKAITQRRERELQSHYPELFGPPDDVPEATAFQQLWWNPHAKD